MSDRTRKALTIAAWGIAIAFFGFLLNGLIGLASARLAQAFATTIVFGNLVCLFGCIQLARAKGHEWYVGILGIFNFVGLAVLWFVVRDKR
jgi:hypothetical protein